MATRWIGISVSSHYNTGVHRNGSIRTGIKNSVKRFTHALTHKLYLFKQKQNNFKNEIQSFPIIVAL